MFQKQHQMMLRKEKLIDAGLPSQLCNYCLKGLKNMAFQEYVSFCSMHDSFPSGMVAVICLSPLWSFFSSNQMGVEFAP